MINDLPTCYEVVSGKVSLDGAPQARKPSGGATKGQQKRQRPAVSVHPPLAAALEESCQVNMCGCVWWLTAAGRAQGWHRQQRGLWHGWTTSTAAGSAAGCCMLMRAGSLLLLTLLSLCLRVC